MSLGMSVCLPASCRHWDVGITKWHPDTSRVFPRGECWSMESETFIMKAQRNLQFLFYPIKYFSVIKMNLIPWKRFITNSHYPSLLLSVSFLYCFLIWWMWLSFYDVEVCLHQQNALQDVWLLHAFQTHNCWLKNFFFTSFSFSQVPVRSHSLSLSLIFIKVSNKTNIEDVSLWSSFAGVSSRENDCQQAAGCPGDNGGRRNLRLQGFRYAGHFR